MHDEQRTAHTIRSHTAAELESLQRDGVHVEAIVSGRITRVLVGDDGAPTGIVIDDGLGHTHELSGITIIGEAGAIDCALGNCDEP